jgi:exodeoxyribonuclease X
MTRMLARSIDFETTGFQPEADVIEFGWTDINFDSEEVDGKEVISNVVIGMHQSQLLSTDRPIEHGARAQHHISPDMLRGKPRAEEFIPDYAKDPDIIIAHNAKFEMAMSDVHSGLFKECVWICTLKAAYRLVPKSPNHQNQTLRYYLNLPCDPGAALPSHRAGPDSYVTAHIFAKFLTAGPNIVPQMVHWSTKPALMPRCPIGAKTRNLPWPEVDQGFLQWILRQPTMEEDIKYSAQHELNRRANNQ